MRNHRGKGHKRPKTSMEAGRKRKSGRSAKEKADHRRILRSRGRGDSKGNLQGTENEIRSGADVLPSECVAAVHGHAEKGRLGSSVGEGSAGSDGGQSSSTLGDHDSSEDRDHHPNQERPEEIIHRVEYLVHNLDPFDKQKQFIDSPLKRKILRAGRRGGKTTGLSILATEQLVEKQRRVLYAVPTGDQITRFWHEIVQSMAELIEHGIVKKYEGDKIIEYPGTEQRIRAKTAWNADTLRGDYADFLILDEFQLMNEDTWGVVALPMLMDNNGDAVLVYTPPSLHSRSSSKANDKRHAAKMFKAHLNDPRWLCLHWTSHDNPHVSEEGIAEVSADMTALSIRQEIMAEDIEEVPGALWKQKMIDDSRRETAPALIRIVVGVDPSGGSTTEVGIVAAGLGADGHGYILDDKSLATPSPKQWAAEVTWLYYERKADRVLGEDNYGGAMVETTIKMHDENISYKDVHATRGKLVRAEPICALYEKGVIHHVGTFAKLEEEMCSYVPGELSPNRMDALVWCLTELFPERLRLTLVDSQLEEIKKQEQKIAVQTSTLTKPVITDQTARCPECESTAIVRRGPLTHCNSCGHEFGGPVGAPSVGGRGMLK